MNEGVDLRRLQVLRMIHEHGTVTAAAAALHLTPSAVSHQIRQLSRELGLTLLEPDGRRVRLTPVGRRLVAHADALHEAWERVRADLASLGDRPFGVLRLCAFPTAVAGVLVPAARMLRATCPELEVRINEVSETVESLHLLLSRDADIALISPMVKAGPPLDDGRYEQRPLVTEPLDLLVSTDHPLSGAPSTPLETVARDPWVLASPERWDCHQLVASACAAAGFTPRVVHEAETPIAVASLVGAGLGVAVVPRLVPLPAHHNVSRVPLEGDPPPQRRILSCIRRGSGAQPAIARGLDALRTVAEGLPPPLRPLAEGRVADHEAETALHRHVG